MRFLGLKNLITQGITTDLDFIKPESMKTHPYYQEWLRPFRVQWFASLHIRGPLEQFALSIQRTPAQGPFSPAEIGKLVGLSRGLSNVFAVGAALDFRLADAAMEAFDLIGKAVVILDRLGSVIRSNRAANAIFDDDLRVRGKRLHCRHEASGQKRTAAIKKLCQPPLDADVTPVTIIRSHKGPVIAYVSRSVGVARDIFSSSQVFVVLNDVAMRKVPSARFLRSALPLTAAEALLAHLLATGSRLADIASAVGVSYETVGNQLKTIFEKLGVQTQADLIAAILSLYSEGDGGTR